MLFKTQLTKQTKEMMKKSQQIPGSILPPNRPGPNITLVGTLDKKLALMFMTRVAKADESQTLKRGN